MSAAEKWAGAWPDDIEREDECENDTDAYEDGNTSVPLHRWLKIRLGNG